MVKNISLLALLVAVASGCESKALAFGDISSVVITANPEIWAAVETDVVAALEKTVFTVRDEKTFTATYQDPSDRDWLRLRRFRQMLVAGTTEDQWVAEALKRSKEDITPPQMVEVTNVWALSQSVTVAVLTLGNEADDLLALLPGIAEKIDSRYREHVLAKMFITGADTALARALQEESRFTLVVPNVYEHIMTDSVAKDVHIFRNDNPTPTELIRQIAVTWKSPIPDEYQPEDLLTWRAELVANHYHFPQLVNLDNAVANPGKTRGNQAYNLQAVWVNPPEGWPASGPFITRAVICPPQDRMYLIDAWLYAPGEEKYEYMLQLEEILNSFDCNGL